MKEVRDDPVGAHWDKLKRPRDVVETPVRSIRRFCLHCFGGDAKAVRECNDPCCQFYPWRMGKRPDKQELSMLQATRGEKIRPEERKYRRYPLDSFSPSPLKTIKKYCLECVETRKDVERCTDEECWLWPLRLRALGKIKFKRNASVKQIEAGKAALRRFREAARKQKN